MKQLTAFGSVKQSKLKWFTAKKNILIVFFIIILFAIGYYFYSKDNKSTVDLELQQRQSDIEKDRPGFIESNKKQIDNQVSTAEDPKFTDQQKTANLLFIAYDYESIGDYKNAIATYEKILSYNLEEYQKTLYVSIGDDYKNLGDNDRALENYNIAKDKVKQLANGDEQRISLEGIENKIAELKN